MIYHCNSLVFELLKLVLYHPHTVKGIGGACGIWIQGKSELFKGNYPCRVIMKILDKFQAPRAGLEPATKRLTAAHSTIELPGNEYLSATAQIRQADFGIF